jgi:hypothetical protein
MYFDEKDVNAFDGFHWRRERFSEDDKNPGVAFAFFRTQTTIDPIEAENLKAFKPIRAEDPIRPTKDQIRGILDLFILDADERAFVRIPNDGSLENRGIVDFVLSQEIVMEHSPPFSISLKGVIDSTNIPVWIGTLVGFGAAGWDHPVLLLLTVPGGIIAVSSARGIGRAMEMGLNKHLKRLLDRSP